MRLHFLRECFDNDDIKSAFSCLLIFSLQFSTKHSVQRQTFSTVKNINKIAIKILQGSAVKQNALGGLI